MSKLREEIIKLAFENPGEIQDALLPVLERHAAKKWERPRNLIPRKMGSAEARKMLIELEQDLKSMLPGFKSQLSGPVSVNTSLRFFTGTPISGTGVPGAVELSVSFMGNRWDIGVYEGLDQFDNEIYNVEKVKAEFPWDGGYDLLLRAVQKAAQRAKAVARKLR